MLWSRRDDLAAEIRDKHTNSDYLAGYDLTEALHATSSLEEAVSTADVIVMGVPSHGMRSTLRELRPHVRAWVPVISLAKGFEVGTRLRMTEVIREE